MGRFQARGGGPRSLSDSNRFFVPPLQNNLELIAKVKALLEKHGRVDNGATVWFSLDSATNGNLRKSCSKLPTIVSVKEMLAIYMLYYTGLLPFCSIKADIFGWPSDKVDAERIKHNLGGKLPDSVCAALEMAIGGDPPSGTKQYILQ